jgi:hypothetical protein
VVSNHEGGTKDQQLISFVVRVHGLAPVLTLKETASPTLPSPRFYGEKVA